MKHFSGWCHCCVITIGNCSSGFLFVVRLFMITISSSSFHVSLKENSNKNTFGILWIRKTIKSINHPEQHRRTVRETREHPRCDIITTNFYLFYNFRVNLLLWIDMGRLFVVACYAFWRTSLSLWLSERADKDGTWEKARSSPISTPRSTWSLLESGQLMMCKNHARLVINWLLQSDTLLQFTNCKVHQNDRKMIPAYKLQEKLFSCKCWNYDVADLFLLKLSNTIHCHKSTRKSLLLLFGNPNGQTS